MRPNKANTLKQKTADKNRLFFCGITLPKETTAAQKPDCKFARHTRVRRADKQSHMKAPEYQLPPPLL